METIFVIGHKNPDTDSICSAYCYAHLKNLIDGSVSYKAVRCGNLGRQTRFVFEKAGVTPPEFIRDVIPRVNDIMTREVVSVGVDEPVYHVMRNMEELKIRITPVLGTDGLFSGVITFFEIANFYLGDDISLKPRYLFRAENFGKVLRGTMVKRGDRKEFTAGIVIGAMPYERSISLLKNLVPEETVLVSGKRPEIIRFALEQQMPAIVITGVEDASELDFDFENYRGWVFISKLDTAETHRLLMFCAPTKSIMNERIPGVREGDSVEYTRDLMLQTGFRGLPVLDGNRLVGIVTRSDLIKKRMKKLILMDHNELAQAVDGAENAEIVEIIDHHRLGTIRTHTPIYVYAKPVGSTCTLVYQLYRYHGAPLDPANACLLLAGVLSDTAFLKSPTTTPDDQTAVGELARISGLDWEKLGQEIFSSADSMRVRVPREIVAADFKVYTEFGTAVGIGQVEVVSLEEVSEVKDALVKALYGMKSERSLDWAMLLVTDIIHEDSLLLATDFPPGEAMLRYNAVEKNAYSLPGVLSRKKQLLPEILRVLEDLNYLRSGKNIPV